MPDLVEELEGSAIYATYSPDIAVSKEPGLGRLARGHWQIRR
jgi:hypothetical protein